MQAMLCLLYSCALPSLLALHPLQLQGWARQAHHSFVDRHLHLRLSCAPKC